MWCSALGCYVGVGETSRKHKDRGGEVERGGSGGAGMVEGVAGRQQDGNVEDEELEDRTTKRPRVEITDG